MSDKAILAIVLYSLCCGVAFAYFVGEVEGDFEGDVQPLNSEDRSLYKDCGALQEAGYSKSGVYRLYLNDQNVLVPCEFRDGKALTVFLRRISNATSFHRKMADFVKGFGDPAKNYWAGLNNIHSLSWDANKTLVVILRDWKDKQIHLNYANTHVEDEQGNYTIHLGEYSGSVPLKEQGLYYHNHMPFTSIDSPKEVSFCASVMRTGWWYGHCAYVLLTGQYYHGHYKATGHAFDGLFHDPWRGFDYSLKYVTMAFS